MWQCPFNQSAFSNFAVYVIMYVILSNSGNQPVGDLFAKFSKLAGML